MPRVANHPRATARVISNDLATSSPLKSPAKIPLNDDAQEKAARLHSRQALYDLQLNQIRAAASPMRKLPNFNRAASTSPRSPRDGTRRYARDTQDDGLEVMGSNIISPVKRVPILANFEEWMKMATDNKINATNSWNFALIDYFHDMSLLKEGDGVNFQKASCTLDGCVKIYTSRVDSVATETGKLLSGLTDNGSKKRKGGDDAGEDEGQEGQEGEDDEEEDENGVRKRTKKRTQRSAGATLATSFAQLQLKKFDLEFSVDPLFKKAAADFDEGGAKGLLLNNLSIDAQGRITFDSSDEQQDTQNPNEDASLEAQYEEGNDESAEKEKEPSAEKTTTDIDIDSLAAKFFPDISRLDDQDVCPSLKDFNFADGTGDLDIPFLKARQDDPAPTSKPANLDERSGIVLDDGMAAGFDDDDEDGLGGFDLPPDTGFGEGGEAWARDASVVLHVPVGPNAGNDQEGGDEGGHVEVGGYDGQNTNYVIALNRGGTEKADHDDILSYFDDALQKNWAGPEHWRIRKIKDTTKAAAPAAPKPRKEKEPFAIDFLSPLDPKLATTIYTPAASTAAISLPKSQWKSKTRNLLPDDKHFHSRQLVQLFLKPKARLRTRRKVSGDAHLGPRSGPPGPTVGPDGDVDEAYWAQDAALPADDEGVQGNYDANFFQDDGLAFPGGLPDDDDDDFVDAQEGFAGKDGADGMVGDPNNPVTASQDGGYGAQLVTQGRRMRPEYVQYARVAKKVDVRRLKDEMWRGMSLDVDPTPEPTRDGRASSTAPVSKRDDGSLQFTSVIQNLQTIYPQQTMADISTSYCFICLLHLANEKGLEIANEEGLTDLNIRKDLTADASGDDG